MIGFKNESNSDFTEGNRRFLILYGSETGQSEAIAEQIEEKALENKLNPSSHCLSQVKKSFHLEKENFIVFVVSTTGDGDIPDKARKFWRILQKSAADSLKHLRYTLLALGDTNYTNFCNSGKKIDNRLIELGANKFYPTGHADDGTGLEVVVEPWIEGLWQPLRNVLNSTNPAVVTNIIENTPKADAQNFKSDNSLTMLASLVNSKSLRDANLTVPAAPKSYLTYSWEKGCDESVPTWKQLKLPSAASDVFLAKFVAGKYLTKAESVKRTVEVTLDITEGSVCFEPGDAFGVIPKNNLEEVDVLLSRLGVLEKKHEFLKVTSESKKGVPLHLSQNATLGNIFASVVEIRAVPKKAFLRALADFATEDDEKRRLLELCSRQGAEEYQQMVRKENLCLMDVLTAFPSCKPSLEVILENLPPLMPRFYSVVNSPELNPNIVKVALNVIEFTEGDGRHKARRGVCSGYLEDLFQDKRDVSDALSNLSLNDKTIPVYLRTNNSFRLPENLSSPIIMIGPGTGVAPFIGFLDCIDQKVKNSKLDRNKIDTWLFFGCRHKDQNFLYEDEILGFCKNGVLQDFSPSFSRDPGGPSYVQDNIKIHQEKFVKLLSNGDIRLYVCGDANGMAKNICDCIISAVRDVQNVSQAEAEKFVKQLQTDKKYLQDIWA